jgi:hypothetical protein
VPKIARQQEIYVPCMAFFNYVNANPWLEASEWPLAPLLSAGRRDAAVWTSRPHFGAPSDVCDGGAAWCGSRLRSGNFVWRQEVLQYMRPSTGGCRGALSRRP